MKFVFRSVSMSLLTLLFVGNLPTESPAQGSRIFSHYTKAHKEGKYSDCKSCHATPTFPTRNWISPRPDKQDPFPDVRNFPYHTACFACHERDKFANGGAFCAGCHTASGIRAKGGAGVRPFPISSHPTQFTTVFPHDVHQDIIAAKPNKGDFATAHFVVASFKRTDDEKGPAFYNCAVCHQSAAAPVKSTERDPLSDQKAAAGVKDAFSAKANYFKAVPDSHAFCFTCHYQRTEPISINCAGCHKYADKPYADSSIVRRFSMKFSHEQVKKDKPDEKAHNQDCMTCHTETVRSSDLKELKSQLKPDVPYVTCANCHESDLSKEVDERAKDSAFQCTYCHTPNLGRYKTPASHRSY
jgi:Cytochrome c7 and related cytochrome c